MRRRGLLANMPILFVPVGAGAILHLELFQRHWLALAIGVIGGTLITLVATAAAVRLLLNHSRPQRSQAETPVASATGRG